MKNQTVVLWSVCLLALVVIPATALAGTLSPDRYYTWGIRNRDLNISRGSIITEAVLTIHGLSPAEGQIYVHLLDNSADGFASIADDGNGDFFSQQGIVLTADNQGAGAADRVYTLSKLNDPCSLLWNIFGPAPVTFGANNSLSISSSVILELIDYAGTGATFGFGIDPAGGSSYNYDYISLDVTIESFENGTSQTIQTFIPIYVLPDKDSYSPGEDVTINFSNASGDVRDWIALYKTEGDNDTLIKWLRLDGVRGPGQMAVVNGSITFADGLNEEGLYEVRLFFNNSYTVEASDQFTVGSPLLSTSKSEYASGENITVNFSNASGNVKDWMGFYKVGAANKDLVTWRRLDGNTGAGVEVLTDGSMVLAGGLAEAGDYEVRLFFNNSYDVEASAQFSVSQTEASFGTSKSTYNTNEAITVNFSDASGSVKDWIALYKAENSNGNYVEWMRLDGVTGPGQVVVVNGSVTFADGVSEAGEYEARLFFDNSYNTEATAAFSVE